MHISCEVLISNRKTIEQSHYCHASLSICKESDHPYEAFLYLCPTQGEQHSKYKVAGNIVNLFMKRLRKKGALMICFIEPEDNMEVKAAPKLTNTFGETLRTVMANQGLHKLPVFNPQRFQPPPPHAKTAMTVTTIEEYPFTTGFPKYLEELTINKIPMAKLDPGILDLFHLRILDVSFTQLKTVPDDLEKLTTLSHLNLSNNELLCIPPQVFTGSLRDTLTWMDLSFNSLQEVPATISRLHKLQSLNLNANRLDSLPLNMGKLHSLRCLTINDNRLLELPASLSCIQLDILEIDNNPLNRKEGIVEYRFNSIAGPLPLTELAARVYMKGKSRIEAPEFPTLLKQYLEDHHLCLCGQQCFDSYILAYVPLRLYTVNNRLSRHSYSQERRPTYIPALATVCSHWCLKVALNRERTPWCIWITRSQDYQDHEESIVRSNYLLYHFTLDAYMEGPGPGLNMLPPELMFSQN